MAHVMSPDTLELTLYPAKAHPIKAGVLAFILGLSFQTLWQILDPIPAVLLSTLLLTSVRDFYFQTHTTLSAHGIEIKGPLKPTRCYPWSRFRTYLEDRNGLFLSPYRKPRSLDLKRGVFLPLTPDQRRQAARFCQNFALTRRVK